MEVKCRAACEGWDKEFASESSVIYAWIKKEKKNSHTGPLSHFYGNLKAIIVPCHSL